MKSQLIDRDNFYYLLVALVLFLLSGALAQQFMKISLANRLIQVMLVLTLAGGVWSIRKQRYLFQTGLALTMGNLLISVAGFYLDISGLFVIHILILLGFFLLTAWVAVKQVLFSGRIDLNIIVGAICIYLLLGLIWAMVFLLLEEVIPGSFHGITAGGGIKNIFDLVYFSYISLTTMGFGDIAPTLPLSRFFTLMEGIVGQFYLAILVASLVGIGISKGFQK